MFAHHRTRRGKARNQSPFFRQNPMMKSWGQNSSTVWPRVGEVGKGLAPVISAFYPPVSQQLSGPSSSGDHRTLSQCLLFYLATHMSVFFISMFSVNTWLQNKIYPLLHLYFSLDNLSIWKVLALCPTHFNNN